MTKKDGSSQCREKVVAQLQSFEIEAKTKAMKETAYQQARTLYDEKITLLEAARQKCSDWQEAEQKLADLQNTKQEKWCSVVNGSAFVLSFWLIVFIVVLFLIIRYWSELKRDGMAGLLLVLPIAILMLACVPISLLIIFLYTENHRLGRRVPFLLLPCVLPCRFSCGRPDI